MCLNKVQKGQNIKGLHLKVKINTKFGVDIHSTYNNQR